MQRPPVSLMHRGRPTPTLGDNCFKHFLVPDRFGCHCACIKMETAEGANASLNQDGYVCVCVCMCVSGRVSELARLITMSSL